MKSQDPPQVPDLHRPLRLRQHVHHPQHAGEDQRRHLLGLPPVLHRQAEVRRHRRPRRAVQQEVRRDLQLPEDRRRPGCPQPPRPSKAKRTMVPGRTTARPSIPTPLFRRAPVKTPGSRRRFFYALFVSDVSVCRHPRRRACLRAGGGCASHGSASRDSDLGGARLARPRPTLSDAARPTRLTCTPHWKLQSPIPNSRRWLRRRSGGSQTR